jgi:hypothetical protein
MQPTLGEPHIYVSLLYCVSSKFYFHICFILLLRDPVFLTLTSTDYFTKWAEAILLTHVNEKVVIQFIEQHLITRFGMPSVLVFDNVA